MTLSRRCAMILHLSGLCVMNFDICFLDGRGKLACQMTAYFNDPGQAARYAREVMDTRSCAGFRAAEIHGVELPMAFLVEGHHRHAA